MWCVIAGAAALFSQGAAFVRADDTYAENAARLEK